jgi:hypothetical protein
MTVFEFEFALDVIFVSRDMQMVSRRGLFERQRACNRGMRSSAVAGMFCMVDFLQIF